MNGISIRIFISLISSPIMVWSSCTIVKSLWLKCLKVIRSDWSIFITTALRAVKCRQKSFVSHDTKVQVPSTATFTFSCGKVFTITTVSIDEIRITFSRNCEDARVVFIIIISGFKIVSIVVAVFISIALRTLCPGISHITETMCIGIGHNRRLSRELSRGLSCGQSCGLSRRLSRGLSCGLSCWRNLFTIERLNWLKLTNNKLFNTNFVSFHK